VNSCVVRDSQSLAGLADQWRALSAQASLPTQHYIWMQACVDSLASDGDLQFLVVEQQQGLPAIAPLVADSDNRNRLSLLGVRELHEPTDLIYAHPDGAEALAEALADLGRPLFLERMPADSLMIPALQKAFKGRGVVVSRRRCGCPWLSLDDSWVQPERHLNSRRRSDLRRMGRKAEKIGPVAVEILTPTPDALHSLLDEAFKVEGAGWKGREGTALISDPLRRGFYTRYADAACREGILRLSFLRIGGQAAATQIAVQCADAFWLLKIGYDEQFAQCSPGTLLTAESLSYAARQGLRSYEFLGTVEPWVQMWTREVRCCLSIWAYPISGRGVVAFGSDVTKFLSRRLGQVIGLVT